MLTVRDVAEFEFVRFEQLPVLAGSGRINRPSRELLTHEVLKPVGIVQSGIAHPGDHGLLVDHSELAAATGVGSRRRLP